MEASVPMANDMIKDSNLFLLAIVDDLCFIEVFGHSVILHFEIAQDAWAARGGKFVLEDFSKEFMAPR